MKVTGDKVVAAIKAAATGGEESRQALFDALRNCELVLALDKGTEPLKVTGEDQRPYVVAFTDVAAMRAAFPTGYKPRLTPSAAVYELVLSGDAGGLALNPAGPVGGILSRADVASITGTG